MNDHYNALLDEIDRAMRRRVWLDPRNNGFCFNSDKLRMSVADAEALDYVVATATPDPDSSRDCLTDQGEYVRIASAKAWGYKIGEAKKLPGMPRKRTAQASTASTTSQANGLADEALSPALQRLERRIQFLNLPEAAERPSAATALASSPDIIDIEQARTLLRGLPIETNEQDQADMTYPIPENHQKLLRKIELHIAALHTNGNNGNGLARARAERLGRALGLYKAGACSFGSAMVAVGLKDYTDTIYDLLSK